jgi:hypothetical protein
MVVAACAGGACTHVTCTTIITPTMALRNGIRLAENNHFVITRISFCK